MSSSIIFAGRDAVLEYLFTDEVWHGVLVVLKAGSGAVGAGTGVIETGLRFWVLARGHSRGVRRWSRGSGHTESHSLSVGVPLQRVPQVLISAEHH